MAISKDLKQLECLLKANTEFLAQEIGEFVLSSPDRRFSAIDYLKQVVDAIRVLTVDGTAISARRHLLSLLEQKIHLLEIIAESLDHPSGKST